MCLITGMPEAWTLIATFLQMAPHLSTTCGATLLQQGGTYACLNVKLIQGWSLLERVVVDASGCGSMSMSTSTRAHTHLLLITSNVKIAEFILWAVKFYHNGCTTDHLTHPKFAPRVKSEPDYDGRPAWLGINWKKTYSLSGCFHEMRLEEFISMYALRTLVKKTPRPVENFRCSFATVLSK